MNKTPILKLNNSDDVVIARTELPAGSWLESESMETRDLIPAGHKIALRDIPAGSAVKRYGQIIGFATRDIRQGEHIHVHNLGNRVDVCSSDLTLFPYSTAKPDSILSRWGLSPAVMSNCEALSYPTALRLISSGASSSTIAAIMTSRSAISSCNSK